ncbi:MAG: type II toxin-antitoxin system RatA family toxin [Pseudomonadota bacterium]|nr:type II toxin-antitoxin system RatA family toxin [Pseudomonadota bacterium]
MRRSFTHVLPYRPEQLFDVVADVRRYPEFIPYLNSMRVWEEREEAPGYRTFKAEAKVGFGLFRESFGTLVGANKPSGEIEAYLISGPFHRLENRWKFHEHPQGTVVDFFIELELKSRLLQSMVDANSDKVTGKIVKGFEARARELYGAPEPV